MKSRMAILVIVKILGMLNIIRERLHAMGKIDSWLQIPVFFVLTMSADLASAGAWGTGSFDNDDAAEWVSEYVELGDSGLVSATLKVALAANYIEAPAASAAIVAAEVVAASRGKVSKSLPANLRLAIREGRAAELVGLAPMAIHALERIEQASHSELAELWSENKDWSAGIRDLIARLK